VVLVTQQNSEVCPRSLSARNTPWPLSEDFPDVLSFVLEAPEDFG
jgi:hypothetical protein